MESSLALRYGTKRITRPKLSSGASVAPQLNTNTVSQDSSPACTPARSPAAHLTTTPKAALLTVVRSAERHAAWRQELLEYERRHQRKLSVDQLSAVIVQQEEKMRRRTTVDEEAAWVDLCRLHTTEVGVIESSRPLRALRQRAMGTVAAAWQGAHVRHKLLGLDLSEAIERSAVADAEAAARRELLAGWTSSPPPVVEESCGTRKTVVATPADGNLQRSAAKRGEPAQKKVLSQLESDLAQMKARRSEWPACRPQDPALDVVAAFRAIVLTGDAGVEDALLMATFECLVEDALIDAVAPLVG